MLSLGLLDVARRIGCTGFAEPAEPQLARIAVTARRSIGRWIVATRREAVVDAESHPELDDLPLRQIDEWRPDRDAGELGAGVPITYVPARNTIFLSFALAWAEVLQARTIFIGVNALDYSGYPDCRPEYIRAYEEMANLATRSGTEEHRRVAIRTPLIDLTKRQIIELGMRLGVDYSLTTSCYDPSPNGAACGHCDACQLRLRGFREAGASDPARYVEEPEGEHLAEPSR